MGTVEWGPEIAEVYDDTSSAMFDPAVLDPVVERLADLAGAGGGAGAGRPRALELAIGTGRVALPLSERDVAVDGIELSPHMAAQLQKKTGADRIKVTIGNMASTRVEGTFGLVYLVFNTIMNLTTQDEQVDVFRNAAAHLEPGGRFVLEVLVPQMRRLPPGELGRVFTMEDDHVGIETFDEVDRQVSWSHHWMQVGDRLVRHSAPYRYVWPAELDLMARLAGLDLEHRWAGWDRQPFEADSIDQVVVYRKPA
jgi:SAM-dependent methyltransferase